MQVTNAEIARVFDEVADLLEINGEGFFRVLMPDGRTAYTRDGSFERSSTGLLVTADGYQVEPGITIPSNATGLTVNSTGQVQAVIGNATSSTTLGQIQLATFINKSGLESKSNNLFFETASSGAAQVGTPGDTGFGTLIQSELEISNVDAVTEISDLISAQRAYEMNSRVIKAADEMMQTSVQQA